MMKKISEHVTVYENGMNAVAIRRGDSVCLINCNGSVSPGAIGAGDAGVKLIVCLNYRASINGGVHNFPDAKIAAPESQINLFEAPLEFLADERNRLRLLSSLRPDNDVMTRPARVAVPLRGGQSLDFEGVKLDFVEAFGDTDGELYCVINDGIRIAVCGDIICGDGKLPFISRLNKGMVKSAKAKRTDSARIACDENDAANADAQDGAECPTEADVTDDAGTNAYPGDIGDYHAFLLRSGEFYETLKSLRGYDILVPARGGAITDPAVAVETLIARHRRLYENYTSASAMNFYFSHALKPKAAMPPAKTAPLPDYITPLCVSFLIKSKSGRGFLIDCGAPVIIDQLRELAATGGLRAVDGCFVTHYHFDHVDCLNELNRQYGAKIYTTPSQSAILDNPDAFYLPCLADKPAAHEALCDGRSFRWEEFTLTAYEFPGQTLHHGALLLDDGRTRTLFCGDSFSPTGLDDYCMQNRCLTGGGRGFRKCLDIIERIKPDLIINSHQATPFVYTQAEIGYMREALRERDAILSELSPWPAPDMSLDPGWTRFYPYVSRARKNEALRVELHITSHLAGLELELELSAVGGAVTPDKFAAALPPPTCGYAIADASGITGGASGDVSGDDIDGISGGISGDVAIPLTFIPDGGSRICAISAKAWVNKSYYGEACRCVIIIDQLLN